MNDIPMRAYCGEAVYEALVRPTEEGVEEFRESVKVVTIDLKISSDTNKLITAQHTQLPVFISIPGGRA